MTREPLFWVAIAATILQAVALFVLLRVVRSFGVYTETLSKERRAAELLSRSNAHVSLQNATVADMLSRTKPTFPYHPHSDKEKVS